MDPSIPGVCFTLLAQLGRKAAPGRVLALHTEGLGFKVEGVGFRAREIDSEAADLSVKAIIQ